MKHNNNFTTIHILAAFMVIYGHQYALLQKTAPLILSNSMHGLGVRILFLVSGYLVSASYMRSRKPVSFLGKRLIRLYPSLMICLLLCVICLYPLSETKEHYWSSAKSYIFFNLSMRPKFDIAGLFTRNPFPSSVNGSLWTLPIEIGCYFFLIPIVEICSGCRTKTGTAILLFILMISLSLFDVLRAIYYPDKRLIIWHNNLFDAINLAIWFFIGMCFCLLEFEKKCNWQIATVATLFLAGTNGGIRAFLTPYVVSYDVMCFGLAAPPLFHNAFNMACTYTLFQFSKHSLA